MKKKAAITLFCAVWALCVGAQNTIESIRKEYNAVQEMIAMMTPDEDGFDAWPPEYYDINVVQNLPATGGHREKIRMYYGELPSEEEGDPYPPHYLRFVTAEYNFAAREFREEYLFDNKGQLLFIYALTPDVNEDLSAVYELRMWFDGKRLLRFTAKRAEVKDYIDLETLQKAKFTEEYSGTSIPEKFQEEATRCQVRSLNMKKMFKGVDENTYL